MDYDGLMKMAARLNRGVRSIVVGPYSTIVAAGLLLRFLLMPFSIGPDITFHTWLGNLVAQGHIDIYQYCFRFIQCPFTLNQPSYVPFPPLFYLIDGLYLTILRFFHILTFLGTWQITNLNGYPTQNRLFFFMKALYIPFDLLGLMAFIKSLPPNLRKLGAWSWLFNPTSIYVSYVWGQTDIMVASFVMIAAYFANRFSLKNNVGDGLASSVALGISASFKLFPLAILPVLSLFLSRRVRKKFFLFLAAGLSPFLLMIPFLSNPFLQMIIPNADYLTARSLTAFGLPQFTIYIAIAVYLAILYYLYLQETDFSYANLLFYSLAIFTILYGLVVWLPNWLLWATPLALATILDRHRLLCVYSVLTLFYFVYVQAWGNAIWLGMFYPISESFFAFPNLANVIPTHFAFVVGLAYTTIGVSLATITFFSLKAPRNSRPKPSWSEWPALLLIPIILALVTWALVSHSRLDIMAAMSRAISADVPFFTFYFSALLAILAWLTITTIQGRIKHIGVEL